MRKSLTWQYHYWKCYILILLLNRKKVLDFECKWGIPNFSKYA